MVVSEAIQFAIQQPLEDASKGKKDMRSFSETSTHQSLAIFTCAV